MNMLRVTITVLALFGLAALGACATSGTSGYSPPPASPSEPTRGLGDPAGGPTRGLGDGPGAFGGVGGGLRQEITAVVVEIGPQDRRVGRNGGSAVVLLSANPLDRSRNVALCQTLYQELETADLAAVRQGSRIDGGVRELLRPLYWLGAQSGATPGGPSACPRRVDTYDFARAGRLRAKFGLTGRGPYLAVIADDDRKAGVIDLGASPPAETAALVRYFKASFSQDDGVWTPERNTPEARQANLAAFFGAGGPSVSLASLPRLILIGASQAACPIGDLLDLCGSPPR